MFLDTAFRLRIVHRVKARGQVADTPRVDLPVELDLGLYLVGGGRKILPACRYNNAARLLGQH
jgi:hypothetical protein